ncbi:MAG: putative glycosyl/glycerophosphate transferase involved in teichoic acid biosynthesis [Herbinix sp.]|jgi:CDP-glycerol glycerophosphotransferase (TagB/SpsB family)|nr:putative glycosyl/glycerophosphate transferase involved in teichoic acid biosynthesis [Herbinix sp.]
MICILKEIKYWSQVLLLPIYWISFLIPRSNKIWAFGSTFGKRFADNPKYFYLYMRQNYYQSIDAIWITKDKDIFRMMQQFKLKSYYLYSIKGVWYSLRAGIYLYDNYSKDISFLLSGGATKINLWHGVPLKKINKDNKLDLVRNPLTKATRMKWVLRRMQDEKPHHYVLTTSRFLEPIFSSAFQTNNVINCGYPRNDILIENCNSSYMTIQEETTYQVIKNRDGMLKKILYMPTFRESESEFFNIVNMNEFEQFLIENKILFCIKLHPKSTMNKQFKECSYENVIVIDSQADPYPFLTIVDGLVTDYSSIYFDFLLRDKPIIFFHYDLDRYLHNSRELYFNYEEFTPGMKAKNMVELEQALLSQDIYHEMREIIRDKVFDYVGSASERLFKIIMETVI